MTQQQVEERELAEEVDPSAGPRGRLQGRRGVALGIAGVLVVGAAVGGWVWHASRLPGDAAMEVGSTVVTKAELRRDVATLRAMYGIEPPQGADKLDTFWRDAAKASAVTRILDAAAARLDVVIPGRKVDEALASYVTTLYQGAADAQQQFVAALANAGTSQPAVKEEIRRRLTVDALTDKVVQSVATPTPDAVATAFEARKCSLEVPETRRLRNIVVATRDEARSIRREVRPGASFVAVAKLKSADGSSRNTGGDLGTVAASQLDAAYGKAAFAARSGTVFGPVRTSSGWNVGQVVKVVPGRTATLAEVARALQQQLLLEQQSRVWQTWLGTQIKQADVRYADAYRPKDPDAVPAGIGKWADTQQGLCSAGTAAP